MDTHNLPAFPICRWLVDYSPERRLHHFLVWDKPRNRLAICERHEDLKTHTSLMKPLLTLSLMGHPIKLTSYTHDRGMDDLRCPVLLLRLFNKSAALSGEFSHSARTLSPCTAPSHVHYRASHHTNFSLSGGAGMECRCV